jgi:hypothetical protein
LELEKINSTKKFIQLKFPTNGKLWKKKKKIKEVKKNRSSSPKESFLLRIDTLIEKVGNNSNLVKQLEKLSKVLNEEKYDHLHHIINTVILW